MSSDAVIAGVADSGSWDLPHVSAVGLQAEVAHEALDDAGLRLSDVQALFTAGDWARQPGHLLAEYLGIQPEYVDCTNTGGSSFEFHVGHAVAAIAAGSIDVALVTYGSTQKSDRARRRPRPPDYGSAYEKRAGLPVPIGAYALAAQRYLHEYDRTEEDLAGVAVDARRWSALNPAATLRDPITVGDVLASRSVAEPLHVLDCCLVTDGAGALVVTRRDRAPDPARSVQVLGTGQTVSHNTIANMDDLLRPASGRSAAAALEAAGLELTDIDAFQIYDSFTITVLLTVEALGLCGPGEASDYLREIDTGPGGSLPMNTSGGGLACCHPGMYGIFLLIEAVRQLRGGLGERQVPDVQTALVHATGSVFSSHSTVVLGKGDR